MNLEHVGVDDPCPECGATGHEGCPRRPYEYCPFSPRCEYCGAIDGAGTRMRAADHEIAFLMRERVHLYDLLEAIAAGNTGTFATPAEFARNACEQFNADALK